jgi:L-arabinose isomerase
VAGVLPRLSTPEMASAFARASVAFRSGSGYSEEDLAWQKIERSVSAAGVRGALGNARHGLLGHFYPGMLDI